MLLALSDKEISSQSRAIDALASAARLAQAQVASVATTSAAKNINVEKAIKQQITLLNKIDWSEKVSVKK